MCGIVALWGETNRELTDHIVGKLAHRGPDDRGFYCSVTDGAELGHARLAIIDPAGGHQPIIDPETNRSLIANGMIYNYRELRRRKPGRAFHTASDSESILHTVSADHPEMVAKLDGMFAFVMIDNGKLIAARDPIGIKPLYMGRRNRGRTLCFASEIKALTGVAEDIEEFPAGHVFHSDLGFQSYYRLPDGQSQSCSLDETLVALRTTLEAAVVKRLRSDVPLGAFLSGGLDSSIIAALARRHVDELHTFAVGLPGSPDLEAARIVAGHLDTIHHECIIEPDDIIRCLPQILYHLESFDQDLVRSAIPCYFVARLAAGQVKVVLTGEGADELFAGYRYYRNYSEPQQLQHELRRSIASMHNINLQRVDRMTMAHSLEARVPFLDTSMIELALTIDPAVKLKPDNGRLTEKWILRKAFEDLLPESIVWRVKSQFDEGSGIADLMAHLCSSKVTALSLQPSPSPLPEPESTGESTEQALYRALLAQHFDNPAPVLDLVAHWSERPAA
jgi:asparagine synthase (glutamine-hydrolysing)